MADLDLVELVSDNIIITALKDTPNLNQEGPSKVLHRKIYAEF